MSLRSLGVVFREKVAVGRLILDLLSFARFETTTRLANRYIGHGLDLQSALLLFQNWLFEAEPESMRIGELLNRFLGFEGQG